MPCHACEGLPPGGCALRAFLQGQLKPNYHKTQPVDSRMTDFVVEDLEAIKSKALEVGISTDPTVDKAVWEPSLTRTIKQGLDTFPDCRSWFYSYLRMRYFFRTIWGQA